MIETACSCGQPIELPETSVGQLIACAGCGAEVHIVSAETLPEGAGAADFDAKLIVTSGPDSVGRQILLGGVEEITLGKLPDRHIRLANGRLVSRAHAKLARVDFGPSRWRLEDNRSTNGISVNGKRVESHELQGGDIIRIGDYELRFVSTYTAPAPPVVAAPVAAGGAICPSCRQGLPAKAKICVNCGIDIHTGRALVVSKGIDEDFLAIRADTWIRIISWLIPFGLFPIASEAFGTRKPITTWVITVVTFVVSAGFIVALIASDGDPSPGLLNLLHWVGDPELSDWSTEVGFRWYQLFTHALLHDPSLFGFFLHLGGNLLFLWVFGMRVNELLGNAKFAIVYPLLAIGSAVVDGIVNADQPMYPTLGASGAIMGLAGMYFVFFPVQRVHMAIWFRGGMLTRWQCVYKLFTMRGFWLLVLWIAYNDLLPVALNAYYEMEDNVAHWAHLGGFVVGVLAALILLLTRQADAHRGDLLSVALGRHAWALLGRPGGGAKPAVGA